MEGGRWNSKRCSTRPTVRSARSRSIAPNDSTRSSTDAGRDRGGGDPGQSRPRRPGDRAARRGSQLLRRVRLRRQLLRATVRRNRDGRSLGSGQGHDLQHQQLHRPVPKFMSMWRSPKPVIAQVHGWCVGGGSDMALCADLVIALGGRAHRHPLCAGLGLLPERPMDLPPRPDPHEVARAHRRAPVGQGSGRCGPDQPCRPLRRARGRGDAMRRAPRHESALPACGDEAHRKPGLREHGPATRPRRSARSSTATCAIHPRRCASSTARAAKAWPPRSPSATALSVTTARLRPRSSPRATTSSLPRGHASKRE